MTILGGVDYSNPLLWAVVLAWIMTVVLHEFAHGIVAYWGGDYTIRERGGLTLNPLQYIHPIYSILLPVIFLMMGGIPLPGAATYIRRDLLRGRLWSSAVSLAGPTMNFLIFLILAASLRPSLGWVQAGAPFSEWTSGQAFVGALAFLELFSVFINLIPLPPLDGFGVISPFLSPGVRARITQPPMGLILLFVVFMLLTRSVALNRDILKMMDHVTTFIGLDFGDILNAVRLALYNEQPPV